MIHGKFAESRVESKEFFRLDLIEALRTVSLICGPPSNIRAQDLLNQLQASELAQAVSPGAVSTGVQARRWGESYTEYLERVGEKAP